LLYSNSDSVSGTDIEWCLCCYY